jgi:osmoprotectant transport system substrate-binding protein
MPSLRPLLSFAALCCAVLLGACGGGDKTASKPPATPAATVDESAGVIVKDPANAKVRMRIGSKNFTEQRVLGQIYAQGLAAAGYAVETDLALGDQDAALAALKSGEVDAYPEYTGTALIAFFGKQPDELPKSAQAAYEEAKQGFAAEVPNLVAMPPTPFTSSNEVAVMPKTARRLKLKKISDLARSAGSLTLYGSPECRQRLDCLKGLREVYGLHFKRFVPVPIRQRHIVLTSGHADVSIVFTTDPQIGRANLVLLKDDKGMFPPNRATLVVRQEVADAAGPAFDRTVELLQESLTDENMRELNARVDIDGRTPAAVARQYLQETGLVAAG